MNSAPRLKLISLKHFSFFRRGYREVDHLENKDNISYNKKGEVKHFPVANKEWKDSVYSYDRSTIRDLSVKDDLTSRFVRNFLRLFTLPNKAAKSKRMRSYIRRSSTKNAYISKSEIKQTGEKAIVTVYIFDRHRQFFARKLFYLNNWLSRNVPSKLRNLFKERNISLSNKSANLIDTKKTAFIKNKVFRENLHASNLYKIRLVKAMSPRFFLRRRIHMRKMLTKFNVDIKSKNILLSILKKRNFLKNLFLFKFIKNSLRYFGLTLKFTGFVNKRTLINGTVYSQNLLVIAYDPIYMSRKKKVYAELVINGRTKKKAFIAREIKGHILKVIAIGNIKLSANNLKKVNIVLLQYLILIANEKHKAVLDMFVTFKKRSYKKYLRRYLTKEFLAFGYLSRFDLNKYKFNRFLPGLKSIVGKIYSKKVELNIVSLKYLHLDSDIFTQAISTKLSRKKHKLLKIIRKSLSLVRRPTDIYYKDEVYEHMPGLINTENKIIGSELSLLQGKQETSKDSLYELFDNMFPYGKKYMESSSDNFKTGIKNVLNSVKYKWVTGATIETKGRLTKQYKASRALFKSKHKGNLINLEKYKDIKYLEYSPSITFLRGHAKPNLQHTFVTSRRRIGAFGIKGWISSY